MAHEARAHTRWRKSSLSGSTDCVEATMDDTFVLLRDSKDPSGPVLRFTSGEWQAFVASVRAGEFDL